MQNRRMERSAAYSGILGAILFVLSGVLPGQFPPVSATSAEMAAFLSTHTFGMALGAWLAVLAVAFILWFAYGLFDYLRDASDGDRSLGQWGRGGAVIWGALTLASSALLAAAAIRSPGATAELPTLYVFDVVLFVFSMGAFAAFAFGVAHESRRKGLMPGWLNLFGYLVFIVDFVYTLSVFATSDTWGVAGYGTYVTPILSGVWVLIASIVLMVSVPKSTA
ncbi:MAG: hypothetical protein ACYC8W_08255 [Candidatus Tyrphobacter sp.]